MKNGPDTPPSAEEPASSAQGSALLEAALREALRRRSPQPGFADRVLARAARGEQPATIAVPARSTAVLRAWPASPVWVRGAVAAGLVLGLLEGGSLYRQFREQQRRIAAATAQFQTTERVTVRALAQAREQLQRAGVPLNFD